MSFSETNDELDKKEPTPDDQKEKWDFSAGIAFWLRHSSDKELESKFFSNISDIIPSTTNYSTLEHTLIDLLDRTNIDYSTLSTKEKEAIVLIFGKKAFSLFNERNASASDSTSTENYRRNLSNAYKAEELIKKYDKDNPSDTDLNKLINDLAKLTEVPSADIKKLWDTNQDKDKFLDELKKNYFSTGLCRHIAIHQAKLAADMGLKDTFSTSVSSDAGTHDVMGFREDNGNISFIEYGTLFKTDTPNMKLALNAMEVKSVALNYDQSKGEESGTNVIRVKSKASEVLTEIARGTDELSQDEMSRIIDEQGFNKTKQGLDFSINPQRLKVELNLDTIAGSTILTTTFHELQSDMQNSIDTAYSARLAQEYGNKFIEGGVGTAFSHINLKEKHRLDFNKLLFNIYAKFHKEVKINEFIQYRIAAIVDAIIDLSLKDPTYTSNQINFGSEHRLYFVTPSLDLFVGFQHENSVTSKDQKKSSIQNIAIANNLLAANVGTNVHLGTFSGYKVDFGVQGKYGSQFDGKAKEYSGKFRADVTGSDSGFFAETKGKYVKSDDFRLNAFGQIEGGIGYIDRNTVGAIEISGYAFDTKSLGKFRDPRLDEWGVGFKMGFTF